jgi:hypothetical protein
VENRFQSLPFKCNLQRYNVASSRAEGAAKEVGLSLPRVSDWLHGPIWLSSLEPCFDCKINVVKKVPTLEGGDGGGAQVRRGDGRARASGRGGGQSGVGGGGGQGGQGVAHAPGDGGAVQLVQSG